MRVLHVINTLRTGGAEKLVSQIVPLLVESGHQVDVFVFDGTSTFFYQVLENSGIKVISYRNGCNVYNPLIILKLIKLMRNYDIVHTHNTSPQLFAACASIFCKTRLVTTEHSTTNRRRDNKLLKYLDRWMYNCYDKIICISKETERILGDYIPTIKDRLITIYNGIDIHQFANAPKLPDADNHDGKFIVTMVARFSYQKDQITVIKAFSHLDKSRYELWLVGDGVNRNNIEDSINKLGLQQNVCLLGIRNDVPSILKSSDVILQYSHIEGFGLAAVEGMAAGKPVIASDIPGLAEVVSGAGVLVQPRDEFELAQAIQYLDHNKEFYNSISLGCSKRATRFDIANMVEDYNKIYRSI